MGCAKGIKKQDASKPECSSCDVFKECASDTLNAALSAAKEGIAKVLDEATATEEEVATLDGNMAILERTMIAFHDEKLKKVKGSGERTKEAKAEIKLLGRFKHLPALTEQRFNLVLDLAKYAYFGE